MGEETMDLAADDAVEAILRGGLAREARALTAVVPVLRHLLGSEAQGLVSEAILARVRGMINDIAAQVFAAQAGRDPAARAPGGDPAALDALAESLMVDEALLAHCHALAAEGLIADRLHQRYNIDPVLSPLLQELIAAEDPAVATLAMTTLAAQSRFVQGQRRMELPLGNFRLNCSTHCLRVRRPRRAIARGSFTCRPAMTRQPRGSVCLRGSLRRCGAGPSQRSRWTTRALRCSPPPSQAKPGPLAQRQCSPAMKGRDCGLHYCCALPASPRLRSSASWC